VKRHEEFVDSRILERIFSELGTRDAEPLFQVQTARDCWSQSSFDQNRMEQRKIIKSFHLKKKCLFFSN